MDNRIELNSRAIQGLRGMAIIFIVLSHLDGRVDMGAFGAAIFMGINGVLNCKKTVYDGRMGFWR